MQDILDLIQTRKSWRVAFDPGRPVAKEDLARVLEAARWTPTAHNMQNFEIVVVDDPAVLEALAKVERPISEAFVKENYEQLSFSREELLRRKTGLLASMFPAAWQTPDFKRLLKNDASRPDHDGYARDEDAGSANSSAICATEDVVSGRPVRSGGRGFVLQQPVKADALEESGIASRQRAVAPCPALLVVVYDPSRRAPASEGDFLGIISLGCLMQNLWLEAEALGLGVQIVSSLAGAPELKEILGIPEHLRVAFSVRLGHPVEAPADYLRVRRDVEDFTSYNRYGG